VNDIPNSRYICKELLLRKFQMGDGLDLAPVIHSSVIICIQYIPANVKNIPTTAVVDRSTVDHALARL
jgi:hypothetical protein